MLSLVCAVFLRAAWASGAALNRHNDITAHSSAAKKEWRAAGADVVAVAV